VSSPSDLEKEQGKEGVEDEADESRETVNCVCVVNLASDADCHGPVYPEVKGLKPRADLGHVQNHRPDELEEKSCFGSEDLGRLESNGELGGRRL
jgi:hypothetical protein